jgi:hypothetical protein
MNHKIGHGLKHKTHSVLHVPDDVLWFGSPSNWNSACMESGHKFHAKAPDHLTHLQKDRLEDKVLAQTTNSLALTMASDLIWKSKNYLINHDNTHSIAASRHSQNSQQEVINGNSQFTVSVSGRGKTIAVNFMDNAKVSMQKKSKASTACEELFKKGVYNERLRFLVDLFIEAMKDSWDNISDCHILPFKIQCYTKIKVVANNVSQIYRGHPAYRGKDPWHNWVNLSWKLLNGRLRKVPAQIFFRQH